MQALVFPVLAGLVAWTTDLIRFDLPPVGSLVAVFAGGIAVSLVAVSVEEVGWRGNVLMRLIDYRGAPFGYREWAHLALWHELCGSEVLST